MSFAVLTPDDGAWPNVLRALPHDVYHLAGYAEVCASHERWPVRLAVASTASHVLALPFMVRELPAGVSGCDVTVPYGYPGPICSSDDPDTQNALLAELFDGFSAMGAVSAFIRCHPFLGVRLDSLAGFGEVIVHGDQVFFDLPSLPEAIETSFRAGHRQNISALTNAGFQVRVDAELDVDAFPDLYTRNMVRLGADPYYHFPRAYFHKLNESLAENSHYIAAVSPQGDIAAIALLFTCGTIGQYHLSCTEDRFLRLAPTKLTILGMAEYCRDHGVTVLNLGGGVGARNDSLMAFKAGFSHSTAPFATARIVLDPDRYAALSADAAAPPGFFPAYRTGLSDGAGTDER